MIVEMLDLRTGLVYREEVMPHQLTPVPASAPARRSRRRGRITSVVRAI